MGGNHPEEHRPGVVAELWSAQLMGKQCFSNLVSTLFNVFSRVDQNGKCYTGVLCGLGWNPTTGSPILPEHDIELAFDVQFTVEDIVEVSQEERDLARLQCLCMLTPVTAQWGQGGAGVR